MQDPAQGLEHVRARAQEAGKAGVTAEQIVSPTDMPMDMPTDSPTDSPTEMLTDMPTELTDVQSNEVDNKTSGTHVSDSPTDLADEQAEADPKPMGGADEHDEGRRTT